MEDLLFSLNIILPMTLMLGAGHIFKRIGFFDDPFLRTGRRFCFYVLLSCSLFKNLYDSDLDAMPYRFIIFVAAAILAEVMISSVYAKSLSRDENETGVIAQGCFRSNFAYIGIPLASMFFTDSALLARTSSEISMVSIFVIPMTNIFALLALMGKEGDKKDLWKRSVKGIVTNPCIVSIGCGILVLLFRAAVPSVSFFIRDHMSYLYKVLSYLAGMSTPFSFLMVGAGIDFSHSVKNIRKLSAVVAMKNLIIPGLVMFAAYLLKAADSVQYAILVSIFASPTAVSSAIMASEMGRDRDLADEIVVYTTLFSIISLSVIIYVLRVTGCV